MTTAYVMIPCPECDGSGTLAQLAADRYVGCPVCKCTGEIEVEDEVEEVDTTADCPECGAPCGGLDSYDTCGAARCQRLTLLSQAQEYDGGE